MLVVGILFLSGGEKLQAQPNYFILELLSRKYP